MKKLVILLVVLATPAFVYAESSYVELAVDTLVLSKPLPIHGGLDELEMIQFWVEKIERVHEANGITHLRGSSSGLVGAIAFMLFCGMAYAAVAD